MRHEIKTEAKIDITNGSYTFEDIYNKPFTPKELIDKIKKADILFLPYEGFRGRNDFLFPEETYKLYSYFLEHAHNKGVSIDICISDEDYNELELHAEVINIPLLIVQWAVFPIVTSMIATFLYEKVRHYNRKDINTNVSITVEETGKSKLIRYEGSIENFERAMKSVDEHIFK